MAPTFHHTVFEGHPHSLMFVCRNLQGGPGGGARGISPGLGATPREPPAAAQPALGGKGPVHTGEGAEAGVPLSFQLQREGRSLRAPALHLPPLHPCPQTPHRQLCLGCASRSAQPLATFHGHSGPWVSRGLGLVLTSSSYEPFASGASLGLPESQPPQGISVRPARLAGPWGAQAFQCLPLRLEGYSFRGPTQGLGRPQRDRGSCSLGAMCAGGREGRGGRAWHHLRDALSKKQGGLDEAASGPVPGIQQVLSTYPGARGWGGGRLAPAGGLGRGTGEAAMGGSSCPLCVWMRGVSPMSALLPLA